MAILSITEAAALAGVSRGTLYNRFRDGELSRSGEGIDTAELLRVFGPFNSPPVSTASTDATEPPDDVTTRPLTPVDERIVQRLDEQLAAAERERAWLRELVDAERARVETKDRLLAERAAELLEQNERFAEREREYRTELAALTERVVALLPAPTDDTPRRRRFFGLFG